MSKVLSATCNASGKVTSDSVIVNESVVLSEGKQSSSGVLVLDEDKAWYLTSSATDIKTTLEKVASALTEIANALTAIGAGMTGPTTAPPLTLGASVTAINAVVTQLNTLKGALK